MTNTEERGSINPNGSPRRGTYRVPLGMPERDEARVPGTIASILFHALLLGFLVYSTRAAKDAFEFSPLATGAGGIDVPVGGGGGGNSGTGGRSLVQETAQRIEFAPPPPPVVRVPEKVPEVVQEEVKPVIPPVEKPPEVKPPEVTIAPPVIATVATVTNVGTIDSTATGRGGGTGNDGSAGNGSGTGGGIGTGDGTGTGSGKGPGTGGGDGTLHKPRTALLAMLPPAPRALLPLDLIVKFEISADGKVLGFEYKPTRDRGYNKQLDEMLKGLKFFPATDASGRPVRASVEVTFAQGG